MFPAETSALVSRRSTEELRAGGGIGLENALVALVALAWAAAFAGGLAAVFAAAGPR
jgi:hypothetical protein